MITFKNVNKIFANDFYALKDINFHIKQGELVLLKGASGSGKSTILSLLAGLSKPSSGEVVVFNKHISKLPDDFASLFRREHIGFIFQKFNLIENLSVKENIITPLIPSNLEESIIDQRCEALLKRFDIEEKRDVLVKKLSGGEQQRVVIARALINEPRIIIADEPTANLDEKLSQDFILYLKALKEEGKTIIVATHDNLFFDLDFIDKIIQMKKGVIL
ncbi:MAG TPA: ABC transporter ATP-binding protein [Sulfurospirillum sp. UBA12182]|jgi:putative ABC transport system ATP-binding protein|nr:MAG TPA: ABC transporter ATP-binding protein [Sulfurospirillum sp. UBA12182]